jgi:hypothetical protein
VATLSPDRDERLRSAPAGSLGFESARYFLHGPPIDNLDLSVSKSFSLGGRRRVELRLDAFNALNHTQLAAVNGQVNFKSLDDPTITNLPFDAAGNLVNTNGFGTVTTSGPRASSSSWRGSSSERPAWPESGNACT